ncbi:MAG: Holliday junction branch migration DNA helicase RuvB [Planctomycetota bacterium]|nr:Holliday junction branch migration DNA helicase RuvB [Planctomycetota bacterium]
MSDSAFEPGLAAPAEHDFERGLQPRSFDDFLGQPEVIRPLRLMVDASRARGEVLEHLLFAGGPGLGKTSLAFVLAAETGAPLRVTSGPALDRARDLVGILSQLERGSILFIDEIHRMPREVEEYLYGAMDRFTIEWTLDAGVHARLLKLDLQPFTLVGATTREALLSPPFRSRFGHALRFEAYAPEDLERIVERSAALLGVRIDEDARTQLAAHARGTPRIVNRLLRRARDVAQTEGDGTVRAEVIARTFALLSIDGNGLERADRRVLEALGRAGGGPLGLKNLAVAVEEEEDTLAEVVEPWLIRRGFMLRTPQGRVLTPAGWSVCGFDPPDAEAPLFAARG